MNREPVGKIALKLREKEPDTRNPIEQMRENLTDYEKNVHECIARYKKEFLSDFYVVVLVKKERTMQNVIRHYFFGRKSCPTPDYDQIVYKYMYKDDLLDFLWAIPAKDICLHLLKNKEIVSPTEYPLLQNVIKFSDGTYARLCKQYNNEKIDSPLLNT